uniref:Uncharacterized protein n=1 Tax=Meloidogyne enterolobii TaxID=390850 RepID=A0A6V7TVP7_MELEN|nr:unnamed protein product [Meloidogyne enterolobii]
MPTKFQFLFILLILSIFTLFNPSTANVYHNNHSPLIKGSVVGFGPSQHFATNLKFRKRVPYRDNGVLAINSVGRRKQKMPPRKMIEKPRLRFKGKVDSKSKGNLKRQAKIY